jgi:hypothetical protein
MDTGSEDRAKETYKIILNIAGVEGGSYFDFT